MMSPAEQLAAIDAWLTAHPPPPSRPLTDAEMDAEDYWANVAEQRRDNAMYADNDDRWAQQRADNHLEGCA